MKKKLGFAAVAMVAGALLAVAFYLSNGQAWQAKPSVAEGVRIAITKSMTSSIVLIADEKGFLRDAGVAPTFTYPPSGKAALDAMLKGEADICAASEFVAVLQGANNPQLAILASLANSDNISLVARQDKGIAVPGDLAGKRIGVSSGTIGDYFLGSFLAFNNVQTEQVEAVNVAPQNMAKSLADGQVDAILVWPPHNIKAANQIGANGLSFPAQQGRDYFFVLMTQKPWLDAHPELTKRLLTALLQAEQWSRQHPQEAHALVARILDVTVAELQQEWGDNRFKVTLPQALLVAMQGEAHWAEKRGMIPPDSSRSFATLINSAPLKAVSPGAIGIY